MYQIAVCDDDAAERAKIEGFLRSFGGYDISVYAESCKLAEETANGKMFDVYLLDVVMPKPDGIELGSIIRETDESAVIMYLTSHKDRAFDAFSVRATQYLSKPVSRELLYRELNMAICAAQEKKSRILFLKTKTGIKPIPFHLIVYCESESRCLVCLTEDGRKHTGLTLRVPFDEAVMPLLGDERFIRPHTSFLVNMDYVSEIIDGYFVMKTGGKIPIAQKKRQQIINEYTEYFFGGKR